MARIAYIYYTKKLGIFNMLNFLCSVCLLTCANQHELMTIATAVLYSSYYYIPEKYPYTLPLERSCNKSLY